MDTETNPAPTEGAEVQPIANDEHIEANASDENLDTEGQEQAVEETEEVDWEGKKYVLPKAIKPALMMQADYTRKTQEVAEQRKALEARDTALKQQAEWHQANIKEYARLESINDRLAQFQAIDWHRLNQDDPVRAQALFIEKSNLEGVQRELRDTLTQKQQQALWEKQQTLAKLSQEGRAAIAKAIPNFTPELAKSLKDHGTTYGYTADELNEVYDPRAVQVLHDAYLWRQHLAKQRAAATQKPVQNAEPVPQVQGRRPAAQGLADNLSTAEWVRRREQQLRNRK